MFYSLNQWRDLSKRFSPKCWIQAAPVKTIQEKHWRHVRLKKKKQSSCWTFFFSIELHDGWAQPDNSTSVFTHFHRFFTFRGSWSILLITISLPPCHLWFYAVRCFPFLSFFTTLLFLSCSLETPYSHSLCATFVFSPRLMTFYLDMKTFTFCLFIHLYHLFFPSPLSSLSFYPLFLPPLLLSLSSSLCLTLLSPTS